MYANVTWDLFCHGVARPDFSETSLKTWRVATTRMNERSHTAGLYVVSVLGEARCNVSPQNVRRPQRFWRVRVTVTAVGTLGYLLIMLSVKKKWRIGQHVVINVRRSSSCKRCAIFPVLTKITICQELLVDNHHSSVGWNSFHDQLTWPFTVN
jgi:hypothetical protein